MSCNKTVKAALYILKSMATLFEYLDSAFGMNIIALWGGALCHLVDCTNITVDSVILCCV
jgi:hypothetical protein